MKNVIILGPGRTGSSILAGIIARDRFYINSHSIQDRKAYPDGDYENPELVDLNKRLFLESGYGSHKVESFREVDLDFMEGFPSTGNILEYQSFIVECNKHAPWLWKEPRLVFTIFFWKKFINFNHTKFIFITRDPYQVFRSHSKYGIYYTKAELLQRYEYQLETAKQFFSANNISPLHIDHSEILRKRSLISKLNQYLDSDITIGDYDTVVKRNIKKKESDWAFWKRYYLGALKLKISRIAEKLGE